MSRAGRRRPGSDDQLDPAELGVALDVRDRLTGRAPLDQSLEATAVALGDLVVRVRLVAEHDAEEVLGLDPLPPLLPVIDRGRRLERRGRRSSSLAGLHGVRMRTRWRSLDSLGATDPRHRRGRREAEARARPARRRPHRPRSG